MDAQFARDRNIRQLITIMHETYSLVSGVEELRRMESQAKTINSLARQTIECSYFIRDYLQSRSGCELRSFLPKFGFFNTILKCRETELFERIVRHR